MKFTEQDLNQLKKKGISETDFQKQIEYFKNGFPYLNIMKPAIAGDGMLILSELEIQQYINLYDQNLKHKQIVKFVPASGAASRMFKLLYDFLDKYKNQKLDDLDFLDDKGFNSVYYFFNHLEEFAFLDDLRHRIDFDFEKQKDFIFTEIIDNLLTAKGLNYGNLPKALLKFHKYKEFNRTALEEHLVEGAMYATDKDKVVQLHFTVSPEHQHKFEYLVTEVKEFYESLYNVRYDISFSVQKSSTDTIAVDSENNPFREEDGTLLFRPGGHGALIENLNEIDSDIIFIKNIDNIVPDRLKDSTVKYKKLLAGVLIDLQNFIAEKIEYFHNNSEINLSELTTYAKEIFSKLCIQAPVDFYNQTLEKQKNYILSILNRPVRVCGMVKNQGEPGGGPFWAMNQDGSVSLQVVESSQIDLLNPEKKTIFGQATHFNPVDLVCGVKNKNGEKYDLTKFVDAQTGFISLKSKDGKELKAMELPGLWNGAMSSWNTIFVEVPLITFNPVKTVNDLLRPEHCC